MKLGEMRRHPSYTYLQSAKKWYRKNDERQNKVCQRGKKRQSKSMLLVRLSKKRLG